MWKLRSCAAWGQCRALEALGGLMRVGLQAHVAFNLAADGIETSHCRFRTDGGGCYATPGIKASTHAIIAVRCTMRSLRAKTNIAWAMCGNGRAQSRETAERQLYSMQAVVRRSVSLSLSLSLSVQGACRPKQWAGQLCSTSVREPARKPQACAQTMPVEKTDFTTQSRDCSRY